MSEPQAYEAATQDLFAGLKSLHDRIRRMHHEMPETAATTRDLTESDAVVIERLASELLQPLSSIEAIAYYLETMLPASRLDARKHLYRIQQLVGRAQAILSDAGAPSNSPTEIRVT